MNRINVDAALKAVRSNPHRVWSNQKPESAKNRFAADGYLTVHHVPKFRMDKSERVFTIGSCFARSVEAILSENGYTVLTDGFGVAKDLYYDDGTPSKGDSPINPGVLNKYNVASMRTEIERALGILTDIPEDGLIEVGPDLWYDPQASGMRPNSRATVADVRRQLLAVNGRVAQAQLVFITLGLTETWYDAVTGLALNMAPPPQLMKQAPDRYVFENASYATVVSDLEAIIRTLHERSGGSVRIVVTVSPVPLGSTWTRMDVISANSYSKSTLRAAAGHVADSYDFVDYFPSYEMAVFSPRRLAWDADAIHVSPDMVHHIVSYFSRIYCT